jgi:tetratricopeptide (TPR) repeat protein
MADIEVVGDFPRDDYRTLLHDAQQMFGTAQDRRNLMASLGLVAEERQQPQTASAPAGTGHVDAQDATVGQMPSAARFAADLVELVARPSTLDVAITLARRATKAIGPDAAVRWQPLLDTLDELQKRYRQRSEAAPDLDRYQGWLGFEYKHPYSLSDRFFGREQYLRQLDEWAGAQNEAAIFCFCALGGSGKSALAWYWLSKALTSMRQTGYQGAFWCSFYEKNFNFDEFLRRALAFAGRMADTAIPASRTEVEERLLDVLNTGRFMFVLDGLERLMNGYATIAERAVDVEGQSAASETTAVPRSDRRMIDPRDASFLRRLASVRSSRVLITTRLEPADLEDTKESAPLPNVLFVPLPGFNAVEAAQLWKSIAPHAPITESLQGLFRVCGYHPLVISIVARSVLHAGGTWEHWLQLDAHRDFDLRGKKSEAAVRSHIIGICMRDLPEESYDLLGVLTATGKPMRLDELAGVLLLGSAASGDGRWTSADEVSTQIELLVRLGLVGAATPPQQATEYDVHPVVRGAVWGLLIDPKRERFLEHALSELNPTPDRRGPDELGALSKAIALYQLFVRTGQLDRAWEMFVTRLQPPLERDNANRELFDLYRLLLPERDMLRLLPLTSRRAQADATMVLGGLLGQAGEGAHAERLLRWCGAIRLQIGDHRGFLDASHSRAWQTMYEGRLFETELSLRQTRLEALAYGALDLRAALDCWIGIVLALRGEAAAARARFDDARGKTFSYRWWAQGLAEGLVYLEAADQALEVLSGIDGGAGVDTTEGATQAAWEQLTQGMAYFQAHDDQKALDLLASARATARKANYAIIQCFAIPYLAELLLRANRLAEAAETAAAYLEVDPHERYRLCAADARRVRARCHLAAGDHQAACADAARAFTLAACDGPPFMYHAGVRRAIEVLDACQTYVPPTQSDLDPRWREKLADVEAQEQELEHAIAQAAAGDVVLDNEMSFEEAMAAIDDVVQHSSAADRTWWEEVTGSRAAIKLPLASAMERNGITLNAFRKAFEQSEYKSFTVVFQKLRADRILDPEPPRPVRELEASTLPNWLANHREHDAALDEFLATPFARQIKGPFDVHHFDNDDVLAFLDDRKRRIAVDGEWKAHQWWDQLEQRRPASDMLILAECVLRMPAKLAEVVDEISVGNPRGLAYAFAALQTRRAIDSVTTKALSKTEGWSAIEILLRLQDVKLQLGWTSAATHTREFWDRLERQNEHRLGRLLQLAEELARRNATIDRYYEAFVASYTENIDANLAYLDYLLYAAVPWDHTQPWPKTEATERWAYESARPTYSDATGLTEKQLSGRLELLLNRVGWDPANESLKTWWDTLAASMRLDTRLRLVEELDGRRASLQQLKTAIEDGETGNLIAALAYMDFTILKGGEARLAQERAAAQNRIGNALYSKGQYDEAIKNYEAAIKEHPAEVYYGNLAGAWERTTGVDRLTALTESIHALTRGLDKFPEAKDLRDQAAAAREGRLAACGDNRVGSGDHAHRRRSREQPGPTDRGKRRRIDGDRPAPRQRDARGHSGGVRDPRAGSPLPRQRRRPS